MSKDKIVEEPVEVIEVVEVVGVDPVPEEVAEKPDGVTKLVHPDGRVAYAHESMIGAYKSGGFREE